MIRSIKGTTGGAVSTPATGDALLVQQSDGVTRYATVAQLLGLGGGSAVRRRGYSFSTPNGGPVVTTPYYPIPYACLPGTINGA